MTREPRWLNRIRRIEVFDESSEQMSGPRWALALALASATVAYACFGGALWSLAMGRLGVTSWALGYVAAFAVLSGGLWHLDMRARAANQLIICSLGLGAIWLAQLELGVV